MAKLILNDDTQSALNELDYSNKVVALIRQRYSQDQENAISRKMTNVILGRINDTRKIREITNEFVEYNEYVENCKRIAKEE